MQKKTMIIGSAAASGILLLGGIGAVSATGGSGLPGSGQERDDAPLTGSTLSKAGDAAIEAAGGGKVTETEHSDDRGSAYEVEVTLDNGNQVDVELDKGFNVVHKESDHADDQGDDDGPQDEADDVGEDEGADD